VDDILYINAKDKIFVQTKLDFTGQTKEASILLAKGKKCIASAKIRVMNPYSKENRQNS